MPNVIFEWTALWNGEFARPPLKIKLLPGAWMSDDTRRSPSYGVSGGPAISPLSSVKFSSTRSTFIWFLLVWKVLEKQTKRKRVSRGGLAGSLRSVQTNQLAVKLKPVYAAEVDTLPLPYIASQKVNLNLLNTLCRSPLKTAVKVRWQRLMYAHDDIRLKRQSVSSGRGQADSAYANTASLFSTRGYERRDCDVSISLTTKSLHSVQAPIKKKKQKRLTGSILTIITFSVSSCAVSVELATASGLMSWEMTAETATSHPHIPSRKRRRGGNKRGSGRCKWQTCEPTSSLLSTSLNSRFILWTAMLAMVSPVFPLGWGLAAVRPD